ncbi:hypothetical protein SAMN05444414_1414 [Roseovarius marisflavi]|uniref:Uncharacterized protein n=1 Tax=Roseovarius marisflavi TaxID=1054996 RepID=A0A1M7DGR8_9RHOB|nr:hypothetical protein [Roseovarius marisflavi]SHL78672.1 hypothetical protein SAMN05444414_1414 [Roseovarius marisflavi]
MLEDDGIPEDEYVFTTQLDDAEASRMLDVPPDLLEIFRAMGRGPSFTRRPDGTPVYEVREISIWYFYKLFEPSVYIEALEHAFAKKGPMQHPSAIARSV